MHVDRIPCQLLWPLFIQESHWSSRPVRCLLLLAAEQLLLCQTQLSLHTLFQNASEGQAREFNSSHFLLCCVSSGLFLVCARLSWSCSHSLSQNKETAAHVAASEWFPLWGWNILTLPVNPESPRGLPRLPAKEGNHWHVFTQIIWTHSHCSQGNWSDSLSLDLSPCLQLEKNYCAEAETHRSREPGEIQPDSPFPACRRPSWLRFCLLDVGAFFLLLCGFTALIQLFKSSLLHLGVYHHNDKLSNCFCPWAVQPPAHQWSEKRLPGTNDFFL